MTWYRAWREILHGVRLVMSLVERRGLWMILWWASHLGRRPVQQWDASRFAAWCVLALWWAFLLAWDVGRGYGL